MYDIVKRERDLKIGNKEVYFLFEIRNIYIYMCVCVWSKEQRVNNLP
jgi:hypothetical protein